ncbi:hypothetical protein QBL02_09815 [Leucobacter sp. UT-8R-CII-1-4]|uniref:hypothetical protein n=1 Tax=Leucobacter sp. UT-8R-CII-1-4 TaxID=3040075 RepID=UPI0024A81C5B|nr:hypothetical protein [Leucobacter sp. UT-8R-CII-1-4]MDI6023839.1 hypothetical protein [Leucobacter sp. UT-8R-CII-1-4]
MSTPLPKEPSPRKVRADAIAILAMGAVASVSVIYLTVRQYLSTFVPDGVIWNLPVELQETSATGLMSFSTDSTQPTPTVQGTLSHLQVLVPDLNTVSMICLVIAIGAAGLTALAGIACVVRFAWLFQQGRFFTMSTSRTMRAFTWSLLGGGLLAFACWNLAANGVEAALDVRASTSGGTEWWAWYWILLFAVTASGLIDVALRRAIRLQHETEGLV